MLFHTVSKEYIYKCSNAQNHTITEQLRLAEKSRKQLIAFSSSNQGPPEHIVRLGFTHLQGLRLHNLSWQIDQVFEKPHRKKAFSCVQMECLIFLMSYMSYNVLICTYCLLLYHWLSMSLASSSFCPSIRYLYTLPRSLSLLVSSSQLPLVCKTLQYHSHGPWLEFVQCPCLPMYQGAWHQAQHPRCVSVVMSKGEEFP